MLYILYYESCLMLDAFRALRCGTARLQTCFKFLFLFKVCFHSAVCSVLGVYSSIHSCDCSNTLYDTASIGNPV